MPQSGYSRRSCLSALSSDNKRTWCRRNCRPKGQRTSSTLEKIRSFVRHRTTYRHPSTAVFFVDAALHKTGQTVFSSTFSSIRASSPGNRNKEIKPQRYTALPRFFLSSFSKQRPEKNRRSDYSKPNFGTLSRKWDELKSIGQSILKILSPIRSRCDLIEIVKATGRNERNLRIGGNRDGNGSSVTIVATLGILRAESG